MSTKPVPVTQVVSQPSVAKVGMKMEVSIIPVTDVDRAKEFYTKLGWRLDADLRVGNGIRVIQFTPPGSWCSIQFGTKLTSAAPGSAKAYLVVSDIEVARNALVARGIDVSDFFHLSNSGVSSGLDPERRTYFSRASFSDPDGNSWVLQEVTTRLPGRVEAGTSSFDSTGDLASALRRAAAAHGEHEKRIGQADANWPDWYAAYIVAEQTGAELPK